VTPVSNGLTLKLTRALPGAPPVVFRWFSDKDRVRRWWGPHGFTTPWIEFEPRPGNAYRIEMQPPEGEAFYLRGEFRAVEPMARLAYTFIWEEPDPDDVETLVELEFRARGGETEVSLTQGAFGTEARRALHRGGWTDGFDELERLIPQDSRHH
jgi:uncharacterized protein YndB with AHSA1/START domain